MLVALEGALMGLRRHHISALLLRLHTAMAFVLMCTFLDTHNTAGTFAPFFDGLDRDHGANVVTLTVGNITGGSEVRLHGTQGFEVLVPASEHAPNPASAALGPAPAASEMIWLSVAITGHSTTSVTVSGVPKSATKIRYNWWSNPCGEDCFKCGVYVTVTPIGTLSGELDFLPIPPYFASLPYPRR